MSNGISRLPKLVARPWIKKYAKYGRSTGSQKNFKNGATRLYMAKKKKSTKKKSSHRRRRVSGTSALESTLLMAGSAVVGGIVAPFVVNALDTAAGGKIPLAVTRGAVALAGGVTAVMGKKINPLLEGAGLGLTVVAGVMTINELGLNIPGISGITAVGAHPRTHSRRRVAGFPKVGNAPVNPSTTRAMAVGALYSN